MTRTIRLLSIVIPSLALATGVAAQQTAAAKHPQHPAAQHQGAHGAMGFDVDKTIHHFFVYEDGGAIDVGVKDKADKTNMDGIRAHLKEAATMFGQGHFETPEAVHAPAAVHGVENLVKFKERIKYTYTETPLGGRVDIFSTDKDALAAIHAFLKFQIEEHKTGDKTTPTKRK
jgi:hypothetical protein